MLSRTIGCWVAESTVAELLRVTEADHPGCQIGSYPFFRDRRTGANFVLRSTDEELLGRCAAELIVRLAEIGYEGVDGGI
jgi:hypothetical protein